MFKDLSKWFWALMFLEWSFPSQNKGFQRFLLGDSGGLSDSHGFSPGPCDLEMG